MVRETRHLWVGNLPDNIREDRIREHFKRYGRVQSVKLLPPRGSSGSGSGTSGTGSGSEEGGGGLCAAVAFMDIKSASKAHTAEHKLDERSLTTEYYEPPTAAILHLHESTPSGPVTPTSGVTATVGTGGVYPPRSPRFPHGPAEEFERSSHFYRAGVGPVGAVSGPEVEGYLPRRPGPGVTNYPDGLRGRARDRQQTYRNGPSYQPPHLETGRGAGAASHHRAGSGGGSGGAWSYESSGTRYPGGVDPEETSRQSAILCTPSSPATSVTATSPSQAAPSAPAAMLTLNSASASAARKSRHAKRRRGSGRTVGSGGVSDSEQSSGRGSRSSSRSSCSSSPAASSSSSNSSRSTSPGGSPRGRSRLPMPPPSHHNSTHAEDRRPLAICVRNLPARSSDTSLKDGLFHEYKKHGKVTWVKVVGTGGDRYALVCFKKPEDVDKALEVSHDKLFFGCKIDVAPYEGFDVEDNDFRPYEAELDEFHPKATRTLFIGNLEKDVTAAELRKHFEQFGEIIEIDIKKQGSVSSYAFCQYADIGAVVAAMRSMDGEHLGNNRIKLGFGKSMPTNCVWVDGVAENVSEKYLSMQFHQFGPLAQVAVDRARGHALVFFEQLSCAQAAVKELRGVAIRGRRLQLDFASRECQEAFYTHLEKQGSPSERVWERPPATFDAREPVVPRFEGVPPVAAPVNARFTPRYEASVRGSARGGPHGAHRGAATGPATTQRAGRAGRQPPPRFADFYDEFAGDRTRFRPGSGEEYLSHEEGGSYEQELRDYGYCQRERRTDYPGDSEHSPSPAQLAPEEGTEDAATSSSIPIPARRHSRQHSTASEHDSPPRHPSPPPGKRIHPRLLSCSPRTPYYEDKESDATKNKDSLSPTPSSNVTSIISGSKCDLNSCNRGPHRHVDGKEPPPPVPPPLPSLPPPRSGVTPLPPPSAPESDMKHLQKERVHIKQLLDQLGESQSSSGDESVNNKRLKLNNEHNKVIINNNNSQGSSSTESAVDKSECGVVGNNIPFRKIIEPRRLSDLKGRRISTDSDKYHHRGDYAPSHFIPKRRKTESSSEGGDGEHHGHPPHRDSSDGSRPGTPLCDERPESLIPSEPRRPRERSTDGPISLPLPKFAHQLLSPRPGCGGPGKIVYSIKSPPSLPPPLRHRIEPPPRNEEKKESTSGESATSEIPMSPSRPDSASETERSPRASPTLEERIRMLDEKYEKWSGSRTLLSTTLSTEVMHKKDGEKFKLRTKLPDLNELRSQPSEIVKSVLAKRSVFDEDTKRLENYNDKYEPKDFASTSWRSVAAVATTNKTSVAPTSILKTEVKSEVTSPSWSKTKPLLSTIPLPTSSPSSSTSPPVVTSPKSILVTSRTATPKSPFSTGTPTIPVVPPKPSPVPPQQVKPVVVPPKTVPSPTTSPRPSAKGLQYPFPSHPPVSSPVVPGSPRCQPPLSSPVQCSPALESTDWPPAQPPGLPTPPPSACGSPCVPTTAPPPLPSEEPPQLNKTAIKKENNIISRDPTPVKTIPSTSSSSITTTSITSSVVKKENPSIISTTNLSSTNTPIKIETPITPPVEIKQEVSSPPPCAPISRKDSQSSSSSSTSSTSSSSSAASSKKESSHKPHHKSHSQDRVARSEDRRESTEERTRTKERHNSGKEHRPASVGSKRRISSQDEPQHKELVIASIEQPETKRPKLSPSNSTEKSQKSTKTTPDRRDSKDGSRKVESSKKSEERRKHSSEKSDKSEKSERDKKSDEKSKTSEEKSRSSEEKTKSSEEKSKSDEKLRTFEDKSKSSEDKSSRISEEKSSRNSEEKSSRSSEEKSSRSPEEKSSRSPEEKSSRSSEEKSSRSSDEKSSRSPEEKSSRSSEEKSSRGSEEKASRGCDDKTNRSLDDRTSRNSEEKSSRSLEEKSSRSSEEKSSRNSEEKSSRSSEEKSSRSSEEKSSRNPEEKSRSFEERSSRNSEEKSSRSSEEKSRSSEEKSRSSEEKSRSSEEKSRSSEEKTRDDKSSHDRKSHSEKKQTHSNPTSQNSQTERGEGERHKSKERKRSKSERERSGDVRRPDDKQRSKDDGRERSKHDPDDKSKSSSKQRDKKSDKSDKNRRSESERRKERSTPKKTSSQPSPPAPTTPVTPQLLPQQSTPPQTSQEHLIQPLPRPHRDSANSDSDLSEEGRLKKHSIFDIVDDEPAYISMYDKVKARSTKNMQKQEEEKQKERLKEKFNQLKQSRAKREEKKRSTSWDEDSDSDGTGLSKQDRLAKPSKRHGKLVITSSSEDEGGEPRRSRLPICSDITNSDESENELKMKQRNHRDRNPRLLKSEPDNTDDDDGDGSARTKMLHAPRRNFKPKITSDTSDYDDPQKYKPSPNFDIYSDSDVDKHHITSTPFNTPAIAKAKAKLENSLEIFESSDEGHKFDKKHFDVKFKHEFSENEAPNSLGTSERIHGNCVDKQQRKSHKKSKRRLSGKNNCTVTEHGLIATEELEVRLERLDESRLHMGGDHKRPSEEKQRSSAEPDKVEHNKTEHKQRSSADSEHKKHSKRERRRSGHHEEKGELDSSKASSKARKKKSKKDSSSIKSESKQRDDKMEDIFGPLSDDSEPEAVQTIHAEAKLTPANNNNTYNSACTRKWQFNSVYSSDSDSNVDSSLIHRSSPSLPVVPQVKVETPEITPITPPAVESGARRAEEKRRKRERRSRERRERKLQREIKSERTDDDLAEVGRAIESQLQEESAPLPPRPPLAPPSSQQSFDVFHFTDDESVSAESCERTKEKKKKRKRSKEERSRKDHHDKSNREVDHDRKSSSRSSEESCKLPNLLPSPTSPNFSPEPVKTTLTKFEEVTVNEEHKFEPVVKPSVVPEKKRPEKLIPGFGTDVDAAIHETAVKSISSFDEEPVPMTEPTPAPPPLLCQRDVTPDQQDKDDKPRTVISQEETEDAVAALLEETFDFRRYSDEADEEATPHHHEPQPIPQEDQQLPSEEVEKETQQAVQSLECELPLATATTPAAPDHDGKQHKEEEERADTPQSEHDLQIDESVQPCSEDETPASPREVAPPQSPPKSPERPPSSPPDIMDFSRPPKTPDIPAAFYQQQQQLAESAVEEKPVEVPKVVEKEVEEKEIVPEITPAPEAKETVPEVKEIVPEVKEPAPEIKESVPEIKETVVVIKEPVPEIKEIIPEVKPVEPVQEEKKEIEETPAVKEEVKVPSPAPPVVLDPEPVVKESAPPPPPPPAEELKVEEVKEEVKEEIVETPVVTQEVPQSPLKVRKVELSAPLMQAMQEAAATPTLTLAPEEHSTVEEEEKNNEVSPRCTRGGRGGGRGGRGRGKAASRGGVSTRRSARGGRVGTMPRPEADHSHTEESAEEKSGETEHSLRGRKSKRGRKKKSESGDDKSKPKTSETNDIYEFHDTDDEDVHFEAKSGEKPAVLSPPPPPPSLPPPPPPIAVVAVPVKPEEPPKPPTPPPEEVPPVPQAPTRRDSATDDGSGRPRLILTIKSPMKECAAKVETREEFEQHSEASDFSESMTSPHAPLANVKSPNGPTRKSRRLQEKDSSRSTVDDIIEDVVRASYRDESAPTSPSPLEQTRTTRRSVRTTRLRGPEEPVTTPSQRPVRTSKSDDEKQDVLKLPPVMKIDIPKPATTTPSTTPQAAQQVPQVQTGVPSALTASGVRPLHGPHMLARTQLPGGREEPTTLIDPVTGLLIPMRESEEGQYIPVNTSVSVIQGPPSSDAAQKQRMLQKLPVKPVELPKQGPVASATPAAAPIVHIEPQRVPSVTRVSTPVVPPPRPPATVSMAPGGTVVKLVPSAAAAPAPPPPALTVTKVQQPPTTRPPVTTPATVSYGSPRGPEMVPGAPYPPWPSQQQQQQQQQSAPSPPGRAPAVKPPPMAHASSHPATSAQPPSVQGARPCHPQPQPAHSASSTPASYGQPDRRDVTHRRVKDEELPLSMLPPRLRVGAVARTSASAALPAPAASSTPSAEPHGLQGCIVASGAPAQPRPPRATSRESSVTGGRPSMAHTAHSQVLQAGLPVPAYEASLHAATSPAELQQGGGAYLLPPPPVPLPSQQKEAYMLAGAQVIERVPNRHPPSAATSRSPPPAHQQGEVVRVAPGQQHPAAGFGVGAPVAHLARAGPVGAPHEVPAHVLHQQLFYQQLLRAQQHHELAPPPPPNSHHHQPAYHLPPAPPGASRSPAVPGLEGKAEAPEASNEALALGPRGHARGPVSPPLELRRAASSGATIPRMPPAAAHLHSPHDRTTDSPQVATVYGGARLVHHPPHLQSGLPRGAEPDKHHSAPPSAHPPARSAYLQRAYDEDIIFRHAPPPAHRRHGHPTPGQEAPPSHPAALQQPPQPRLQVQTPPHASQVPPQADSLLMLLQRYPVMWQGLLALKNDQAAVQMHFVFGNPGVARDSLPCNSDGSTPPLRIAQRMRLEQTQLEGVARKMQMEHEHCMLLALPCGRDHMDVLQQSNNLNSGFITYLQQKQAAGIVNIAAPGSQQAAYVVHIFPSCEFANDNLARIAPDLLHRVADISHLLIIIATV